MTPTERALDLMHRLRHDSHTRAHFDMGRWAATNSCGTFGCIAGTLLVEDGHSTAHVTNMSTAEIVRIGARLLDIDPVVAYDLFLPGHWVASLVSPIPTFARRHSQYWRRHPNWRCDLTTIERMRQWAEGMLRSQRAGERLSTGLSGRIQLASGSDFIYNLIGPDEAALALEGVLVDHPGWVDWQEACEPESVP